MNMTEYEVTQANHDIVNKMYHGEIFRRKEAGKFYLLLSPIQATRLEKYLTK